MVGAYDLEEWERGDAEKILFKSKRGKDWTGNWEDKAESRDERHKVAEKISRMNLGEMADEREAHQGYSMALTPEEKEKDKENLKPSITMNDPEKGTSEKPREQNVDGHESVAALERTSKRSGYGT